LGITVSSVTVTKEEFIEIHFKRKSRKDTQQLMALGCFELMIIGSSEWSQSLFLVADYLSYQQLQLMLLIGSVPFYATIIL